MNGSRDGVDPMKGKSMDSTSKESFPLSVLLMLVSALCFACSGFFGQRGVERIDYWLTLFMRFAFPFALLALVAAWSFRSLPARPDRTQVVRAFSLVMSQGLFFAAAVKTSLFLAMVLYNTGPIFTIVFDAIRTRRISVTALLAALIGFSGVLLTLWEGTRNINLFALVGLASGAFLAISQLSLYASAKKKTHFETMYYTYGIGSVLLLPVLATVSLERGALPATASTSYSVLVLLLVGLFSMGNQYFRSLAYEHVNSIQIVSPFVYATIPIALVLDLAFNAKYPALLPILGSCIIALAACMAPLAKALSISRVRLLWLGQWGQPKGE